jgi:hypothetical protein
MQLRGEHRFEQTAPEVLIAVTWGALIARTLRRGRPIFSRKFSTSRSENGTRNEAGRLSPAGEAEYSDPVIGLARSNSRSRFR